ncbi:hypothetical protein P171DRAFT_516839 [Karstenula rhodostoma CBS 690.94]|uniref:GPI anchored serine-threonine rich protein n=1 Tax=Karstenula rhodostoma CBS 690.94 TaxID=1392251 RepID=A0A9P4PYC3_9PLEO|nr:hypothetical protein P171DRAFT_516839 [Karstenula rhodostoma CBS 690.94]
MVSCFSLVASAALASFASASVQALPCPLGGQVCGTTCCDGGPKDFDCGANGACILKNAPALPVPTSVTGITLVTTSTAGVPTEAPAPNTTVSVPVISTSEATVVVTTNVTSWSTTAFPTGNHTETGASNTHHATGTQSSGKPEASGAAGVVQAGTGLLGAAFAAALGAL